VELERSATVKDEDDCRTRAELWNAGSRRSITLPFPTVKIAERLPQTFHLELFEKKIKTKLPIVAPLILRPVLHLFQ